MVVVGMGTIGSTIARRGAAFEMRVIGVDMQPVEPPEGVEAVWPLDRLDEALGIADVVMIATPQTHRTRGMIDARRINLLKQDAFLVVISRGKIIDEAALIASLTEGRLAGAGLDVTYTEPLPADSPLWDTPNLIVTPHCSAASEQTGSAARDRAGEPAPLRRGRPARECLRHARGLLSNLPARNCAYSLVAAGVSTRPPLVSLENVRRAVSRLRRDSPVSHRKLRNGC